MDELLGVQGMGISPEQGLPPGFRFHPTDEELLSFYLASKVFESNYCGMAIAEVNLNKCEPWDLPEMAKLGEREWYLYNIRGKKYPTSLRTDRATRCGYWKATGKDKKVFSGSGGGLLGMKKTLVFYKGRAPQGEKTSWVMHEYRLAATGVSLQPSFKVPFSSPSSSQTEVKPNDLFCRQNGSCAKYLTKKLRRNMNLSRNKVISEKLLRRQPPISFLHCLTGAVCQPCRILKPKHWHKLFNTLFIFTVRKGIAEA